MKLVLEKLSLLARHLDQCVMDFPDKLSIPFEWSTPLPALHYLGTLNNESIEIRADELAEELLTIWIQFHGLLQRYQSYFGAVAPAKLRRLDDKATVVANKVLFQLPPLVRNKFTVFADLPTFAEDLFIAIVERDELDQLSNWWRSNIQTDSFGDSGGIGNTLDNWNLPPMRYDKWKQLPSELRNHVLGLLRDYRRVCLRTSWMTTNSDGDSAISKGVKTETSIEELPFLELIFRREEKTMNAWIDDAMGQLAVNGELATSTRELLDRIASWVQELGYPAFVEDVLSDEFYAGPGSALGTHVNLIPGDPGNECCSIVVAVSEGDGKRSFNGFNQVLTELKVHLINCPPTLEHPTVVIVLGNHWDSSFKRMHLPEFRAFHARGARFCFLHTTDDRTLGYQPIGI